MLRRLARGAALVAAASMVLAGCTPDAPPVESTPPPASPSNDPPATPSASSDAEIVAEAFDLATALNRLVDQAFREGTLPTESLQPVASTDLIEVLRADLESFTSRGLRLEGNSVLDTPTLISHDRTSDSSGTVVLATCMDTSTATTYDSRGEVVSGGTERQPRLFELQYGGDSPMIVTRTGPPEEALNLAGCSS